MEKVIFVIKSWEPLKILKLEAVQIRPIHILYVKKQIKISLDCPLKNTGCFERVS
jgi:hypothetical protein